MGDSNFFKGTSADQDRRFTDKESKLLKTLKFPPEFETKVDMRKVKLEIIRPWITKTLIELSGSSEDDVLIEYAMSLLEDTSQSILDPRKIQIQMQGFLATKAPGFMADLWKLLIEAQANPLGVPQSMIEEFKRQEANKPSIRMGSRFDAGPPLGDSGGRGPHDRRNDRGDSYGDRGRGGGERGRRRGRGRGGYQGGEGRYGDRYDDHERGPPRRRSPPRYRSRSRSPARRYRSRSYSPRSRRRSRSKSSRSRSPQRRGYISPTPRRRRHAYRSRSRSRSPYGNGGRRRSPPRRGGGPSPAAGSPRGGHARKRRGSDASSIHSSRAGSPPRRPPVKGRRRPRSPSRSLSGSRSPPRSKKMRSPSPPRRRARRSPSPASRSRSPDVGRNRSRSSTPRYRKEKSRTPPMKMEEDARKSPRKSKWENDEMDVDKKLVKSDLDRLEREAKEKALRAKVMRTRRRE